MTDKKTEALTLALEAAYLAGFKDSAEGYNGEYPFRDHGATPTEDRHWVDRRDAYIREALAEQPAQQQEPVAWMFQHEETGRTMCVDAQQVEWGFEKGNPRLKKIAPLYTSPPASKPWVSLTDEEITVIASTPCAVVGSYVHTFARAIEAKLREKNA